MTTCNNLAGNVTFGFRTKLVAPGYRIVCFLPMAHAYGCAFDFLASTCAGCHIHFIGKTPSPKVLLKAFAEVRPSVIFTVPLIIRKNLQKTDIAAHRRFFTMRWVLNILLNQTILGQIRKKLVDALGGEFREIIIGGAPLNAEVEEFFHKMKFPFTVGYGMTECAPLISYANKDEFIPKSCGRILDIMEVKTGRPRPGDRRRRDMRARRERDGGLLQEPPKPRLRHLMRTVGCAPATLARWTRRATSSSAGGPRP